MPIENDFEQDYDLSCPTCGHSPLHNRTCENLWCDDGLIDENDDDPINFLPGESLSNCDECKGTGVEWWCPGCGENLSGKISSIDEDNKKSKLGTGD